MTDNETTGRDTVEPPTTGRDATDRASADRTAAGQAADAYARRIDAVVAGHRGDADAATQYLPDEDAAVRSAALGALARCGELSAQQVRSALSDAAAQVRRRAVELAPPEVELIPMLDDPDVSVVEATAAALGERDSDPAPVPELCRIARDHEDPLCRESAIAALGAIAAGAAVTTTGAAATAAGTTATAAGTAETAAGTTGMGSSPGADTSPADDADIETRHSNARAKALDTLLTAMSDRPQIRRRALLGLHQFDDDRAVDAVRASLDDRDRQVRAVAGELLGQPVR